MTQVSWISTMGYESIIDAVVDEVAKTVRVDAPTLIKMAHDSLDARIVGDEDSIGLAMSILSVPVGPSSLYDVTEVGGGWDVWADDRIVPDPAPTKPYIDHSGEPTDDPRCWLGLCVECIDDSLARGEVPPVPALSTHDPRYLTQQSYRDAVRNAYERIGVTYREEVPA